MSTYAALGVAAAGAWWLMTKNETAPQPGYGGALPNDENPTPPGTKYEAICPSGTEYRDGMCWPPGNACELANGPGWTLSPDGKFCDPPPSVPGPDNTPPNPCDIPGATEQNWVFNAEEERCVPREGWNPCAAPPLGPDYTYKEEEDDDGEMVGKCIAPNRPPQCPNGYVWRRDAQGTERCMRGNPLDMGLSSLPIYGAVASEIVIGYIAGSAIEAGARVGYNAASRAGQAAVRAVNPGLAAQLAARQAAQQAARQAAVAAAAARQSAMAARAARAGAMMRRMLGSPFAIIFMVIAQVLIAVLGLNADEFELCRNGEIDVASLPDWARILIESIPFAGDLFSMIGPTICIRTGCEPPNVEQHGLCYPPPRENFWCEAFLCYSQHPEWQNNGQLHTTTHITKNIKMDTGTIPNHCPPGSRLDGVLCYNLPDWANGHITSRTQEIDVDAYLNANPDVRAMFTTQQGAVAAVPAVPPTCNAVQVYRPSPVPGFPGFYVPEIRCEGGTPEIPAQGAGEPVLDRAAVIAFANNPEQNGARHVPRNEVRTYNTTGRDVSILAGVAWENCPAGHTDTGTRCERVHGGGVGVQRQCPDGFHPDGLTCRRPPSDFAHPCPGYVPNAVGCCLCERPPSGGACRGGNCHPVRTSCPGGGPWYNVANCRTTGGNCDPIHCDPIVLGDTRARRIDHTPLKVLAAGAGSTLPCPAGREVGHDGLCYEACGPVYRREGLLCTQSFDKRSQVLAPFSPSCPPGRIDGAPFGSAGLCYRGDMPAGYRRVVAGTIEQYCPTVPPEWGPVVENVLDIGVGCQRARYERGAGQIPMGIRVKARRQELGPPPIPPTCAEREAIFGALDEAGRETHVAALCIVQPCAEDETMDATASFCVANCRQGYRHETLGVAGETEPVDFCVKPADATGPRSEYRNRPNRDLTFDYI